MIEAIGLFYSAHVRRIGSAVDAGFTLIENSFGSDRREGTGTAAEISNVEF
jgi:hypothetical protein